MQKESFCFVLTRQRVAERKLQGLWRKQLIGQKAGVSGFANATMPIPHVVLNTLSYLCTFFESTAVNRARQSRHRNLVKKKNKNLPAQERTDRTDRNIEAMHAEQL